MEYLVAIIPVVVFLGSLGMCYYCYRKDQEYKKKTGREYFAHPDKTMGLPLYDRGECDGYNAGIMTW